MIQALVCSVLPGDGKPVVRADPDEHELVVRVHRGDDEHDQRQDMELDLSLCVLEV